MARLGVRALQQFLSMPHISLHHNEKLLELHLAGTFLGFHALAITELPSYHRAPASEHKEKLSCSAEKPES